MRAAIVQPMYLPWIGYFGMIDLADAFVFYDDVQFVERSWQRRNRIKMPSGKWIWLSVPIRSKFGQSINEVRINNDIAWAERHWSCIKHAYNRAPFFKEYETVFEEVYVRKWDYLVDLDIALIKTITKRLGISIGRLIRSSELGADGKKTTRLINVLEKIGANEYISGPSAMNYIERNGFGAANIRLYWYEFNHPKYDQLYGEFVPSLSSIDLLFNVGPRSLEIIRKGSENALKTVNEHEIRHLTR